MLIDWFTVVAQAINFLILVWLMKRFLYRPILHAIDEREKKIAAELADADAKRREAKMERDEFARKNSELDRQRADLISKATNDAQTLQQRLIEEARQKAEDFSAKRRESMKADARHLNQALRQLAQEEVFEIARKTLADLAGTRLEETAAEAFIQRLRTVDGSAKAELTSALKSATDTAIVRSAFPLPQTQQKAIQQAITETFAAKVEIRFETEPKVVSGIELSVNGQKLAWSIGDYLTTLETRVSEMLQGDETTNHSLASKLEESQTVASQS